VSRRRFLVGALTAAMTVSCAEKKVVLRMAVEVTSSPEKADVLFRGKSLGETPRVVEVESWADVAALLAVKGDLETVERRIRILSPEKAQLLVRLGKGEVPAVAALRLTRSLPSTRRSLRFEQGGPQAGPFRRKQAEILNQYFPRRPSTCAATPTRQAATG
jgi:hypothetical protein